MRASQWVRRSFIHSYGGALGLSIRKKCDCYLYWRNKYSFRGFFCWASGK